MGANKEVTASIEGHVWWQECKSPGGLGDVVAMEKKDGSVYCLDSPTSRTHTSWKEQGRRTQQLTRRAEAYAAAEREREEEEWREEEVRLAAERQRRRAATWNRIGQTLGEMQRLEAMREHSGSTTSFGAGAGALSGRCQQIQLQIAREIDRPPLPDGSSQCTIRRAHLQMLTYAKDNLVRHGCYQGEYDSVIAEAKRTVNLPCN